MSSAYRIDPSLIPDSVCRACAKLKEAGHQAYLVGGAVRDLLRLPEGSGGKDFDLTTSATPEEVIAVFGFKHTIPTGIAHGTVTVMVAQPGKGPLPVEITTFRGEVGFSDGRRPDRVEFISDLREDLRRRDFTINAIAYDPLDQQLHDCFDGLPDLKRRVLRAVGDPVARFAEDGLRVMRAVRFAAQLEFAVDADTRAAFAGALPTLRKVSRERVRDELQKLLGARTPSLGLRLMVQRSDAQPEADWGPEGSLLQVALPEVAQQLPPTQAQLWMTMVDRARPEHRLTALLWPMRRWLTAHPQVLATPRALEELLDERLKLPTYAASAADRPTVAPARRPAAAHPTRCRLTTTLCRSPPTRATKPALDPAVPRGRATRRHNPKRPLRPASAAANRRAGPQAAAVHRRPSTVRQGPAQGTPAKTRPPSRPATTRPTGSRPRSPPPQHPRSPVSPSPRTPSQPSHLTPSAFDLRGHFTTPFPSPTTFASCTKTFFPSIPPSPAVPRPFFPPLLPSPAVPRPFFPPFRLRQLYQDLFSLHSAFASCTRTFFPSPTAFATPPATFFPSSPPSPHS
jgi:hypothetical protein